MHPTFSRLHPTPKLAKFSRIFASRGVAPRGDRFAAPRGPFGAARQGGATMHYVYILLSKKDGKLYIGETANPERRLLDHQEGRVNSTKHRRPFELINLEKFPSRPEALRRERFLKSSRGWMETRNLKNRILRHRGVAQPG